MTKFERWPKKLYSIHELFDAFDPAKPASYGDTLDYKIYKEFVSEGGSACMRKEIVLARAEHDCAISQHLAKALNGKKVVAIMGGHNVTRLKPAFRDAAVIAATLTQKGYLVISGGGPGAMEAVHLGAAVGRPGRELDSALQKLTADKDHADCSGSPLTIGPDHKTTRHPGGSPMSAMRTVVSHPRQH